MSHSTPQSMPTFARLRRARFWPLLSLIPIGILAGIVSGALINTMDASLFLYSAGIHKMATGLACLDYVRQGMLEGALFNGIFSVTYASAAILISRGHCPFALALRGLARFSGLWIFSWFALGVNTLGLARFAPPSPEDLVCFPASPNFLSTLANALGLGPERSSIKDIHLAGIIAVIVGCIWFSFDWREYQRKLKA